MRRTRWQVIAVATLSALALVALGAALTWVRLPAFWPPGAGRWLEVADASMALAACLLCARAAARAGNRRGQFAWRCQSAGCALWAIAPIGWTLGLGPRVADLGRVGFLACAAAGLWLTFRGPDRRARARMLLDGAVGALSALIVAWALVFAGIWGPQPPDTVALSVSVAYPLGAIVLLIFLGLLGLTEFRPGRRLMPALFVTGLASISYADTRWAQLSVLIGRPGDDLDSGGWLIGFALLGGAALTYGGTTARQTVPSTARWITYAPYLILVPASVTIMAQALLSIAVPLPEQVACVLIVLIILVRQLLLLAENRVLVARLAAREHELSYQALHDSLTGLGNRVLLSNRLEAVLGEGRTGIIDPVALLFCDLDDFKAVNDTLGHHAGDELLIQVAGRLRAVLRPADTIARLGGDEFAVLMECAMPDARLMARRVWETFQEPFVVLGHQMSLGVSIGMAAAACGGPGSATELLKAADIAMYEVKRHGKNDIELFSPRLPQTSPAA